MAEKLYNTFAYLAANYHEPYSPNDAKAERKARADELAEEFLPSGSGFDSGSSFDIEASNGDKLILYTKYHHMVEGVYTKWTEHKVIVTFSMAYGLIVKVQGSNYRNIRGYIADQFHGALKTDTTV